MIPLQPPYLSCISHLVTRQSCRHRCCCWCCRGWSSSRKQGCQFLTFCSICSNACLFFFLILSTPPLCFFSMFFFSMTSAWLIDWLIDWCRRRMGQPVALSPWLWLANSSTTRWKGCDTPTWAKDDEPNTTRETVNIGYHIKGQPNCA